MKKKRFKRDIDYWIDEYMYNCRSRKLRPKTMIRYEQTLRLFERWCLMNGMDNYTLSRILGHSSVSVTENAYLDLTGRDPRHRYQNFSPIENMRT